MDENNKDLELTPEEQKADEEATKEVSDDELRETLAEDLGIDPESEENSEMLEKLIAREKANHERLSVAIKQKRTWRERATTKPASENPKDNPKDKETKREESDNSREAIRAEVRAELEERDLKSLSLPEEIEAEVKELSTIRKISVREASELPYIKSRIAEIEKEQKLLEASANRSKKGEKLSIGDLDLSKPLNPEDFKTESGAFDVEKWDKAKEARERFMARQKTS